VAVRRTVLLTPHILDGANIHRVRVHHHRVHRRAVCGHLPSAQSPHHIQSAARRQDHLSAVAGRRSGVAALPAPHAHLLLPVGSANRKPDSRLASLQHPVGLDAADVPRDPGVDAASVRRSNVRHDGAVRANCAVRPPVCQLSGNAGREVARRRVPRDGVDVVHGARYVVCNERRMRRSSAAAAAAATETSQLAPNYHTSPRYYFLLLPFLEMS